MHADAIWVASILLVFAAGYAVYLLWPHPKDGVHYSDYKYSVFRIRSRVEGLAQESDEPERVDAIPESREVPRPTLDEVTECFASTVGNELHVAREVYRAPAVPSFMDSQTLAEIPIVEPPTRRRQAITDAQRVIDAYEIGRHSNTAPVWHSNSGQLDVDPEPSSVRPYVTVSIPEQADGKCAEHENSPSLQHA